MAKKDPLEAYKAKRDFAVTAEPSGAEAASGSAHAFVVQKHWARRLHYDFRLELDGVMKSWAVPKGPTYDPAVKRMAVQVEDHPVAYNSYEGEIPEGQYGAGRVIIWDEGTWVPLSEPRKAYRDGHLKFELHGKKMQGRWVLVRIKSKEREKQPPWLLIKEGDEYARSERSFSVVDEMPDSVVPLRKRRKTPARAKAERADIPPRESLPGVPAEIPASLKPQLATLAKGAPRNTDEWIYENKFDGYRILARIEHSKAKLFTRSGRDWSSKIPGLAAALGKLDVPSVWLDGEIVVLADNGAPSFQALQNAFGNSRAASIVYYVFDMPFVAGRDIRREPLHVRRALLEQLIGMHADELGDTVRFSAALEASPARLMASACKRGFEGIIAKHRDSPYVSRRAETWLKLKCAHRQEFVIVGYTAPQGSRTGLGALLLAVRDGGEGLRYAGKVGTGFDERSLVDLSRRLARLGVPESPLGRHSGAPKGATWVKPVLVAEVSFGEWTESGHIRHASFRGLRSDKSAADVERETPIRAAQADTQDEPAPRPRRSAAKSAPSTSARLTHPDRVIDSSTGLTKLDVARYYGLAAPLLLEHLKGRPVAFLRAPEGIDGQHFFQKHWWGVSMPGVRTLPASFSPGHPALMEVSSAEGIMSASQMNVIEFHTWNAVKTSIAKPDRILFDLDPGEGVQWPAVCQAAELVHVLLRELGLPAWLKTSGGKGLHVDVPIRKQYGWDEVKGFSEAVVRHLARTIPAMFVAKSGPRNRVGKIYVDYLRNGFGATTVAAWSLRARPGMGVSVPIAWDEIGTLCSSAQWHLGNIHERVALGNEPWQGYRASARPLGAAMKALGFEPGK